jgi:hypothetical protein
MGEVVNLRRARKAAGRQQAAAGAAAKRQQHGRSKSERALEDERHAKAQRDLDQHRLEPGGTQ